MVHFCSTGEVPIAFHSTQNCDLNSWKIPEWNNRLAEPGNLMEQYLPEFPEKRTTLWSAPNFRKYSYHHFIPFDCLPEFQELSVGWFTSQELNNFRIPKSRHLWLNAGKAPLVPLSIAMWFALTFYHWVCFIWLCWWLPLGLSKRQTVVGGWHLPGRSQDDLL